MTLLVEEHCNKKIQEELNGSLRGLDEGLLEPSYLLATLPPWRRIEEILPLFNEEETQKVVKEEAPKLILKPLPTELKYAYPEENKQSLVVISSPLTTTVDPQFCPSTLTFILWVSPAPIVLIWHH